MNTNKSIFKTINLYQLTHTANNVWCLLSNFIAATKNNGTAGILLPFADTLHAQQLSNKLGTVAGIVHFH